MKYAHCVRCGKQINEGSIAIRRKGWTGFYCCSDCFVLDNCGEMVTVTNELIEEDKGTNEIG